jgi:hypothetical protein
MKMNVEYPAWQRLRELTTRQEQLVEQWVSGAVTDIEFFRRDALLTARIRELKEELGIANND